jgi:8-oxo-dGTP pyrophosphatase MutT (NUDIX family)
MSNQHTHEENLAWHNALPAKHMAAHLLCWNDKGELLFVMPSYDDFWQLPGGVVEQDESPLDAAVREALEETGLPFDKQQISFVGVNYAARFNEWDDFVHFYFSAGVLKDRALRHIGEASEKMHGLKFLNSQQLALHVSPQRLSALQTLYVEGNSQGMFTETKLHEEK